MDATVAVRANGAADFSLPGEGDIRQPHGAHRACSAPGLVAPVSMVITQLTIMLLTYRQKSCEGPARELLTAEEGIIVHDVHRLQD
jgi:hypothetical protein